MKIAAKVSGWLVTIACACGPAPAGTDSGTTSGGGSSSGTTSTATGGSSGSTVTPTTGEPAPFCADPQPIFLRDGVTPSGFERCANGVVHRAEGVACAVEGVGNCQFSGECDEDADCLDSPHGTCHEMAIIGCFCRYGCGSDDDCELGEICVCAGVINQISQCVEASCVDDGSCGGGLCGLTFGGGGCGTTAAAAACIDASSPCLVDEDCPDHEVCGACWPEGGKWACGEVPGCGIVC